MSSGHTHREVRVPDGRFGDAVVWLATRPVWRTTNLQWADRSRLVFKPGSLDGVWVLSVLGVLHGLTGLTLTFPDDDEESK